MSVVPNINFGLRGNLQTKVELSKTKPGFVFRCVDLRKMSVLEKSVGKKKKNTFLNPQ